MGSEMGSSITIDLFIQYGSELLFHRTRALRRIVRIQRVEDHQGRSAMLFTHVYVGRAGNILG